MALEVFCKLNELGESSAEDHIFIGNKKDLVNISNWLGEQYLNNKRKKKVNTLAEMFKINAQNEVPFVRLTKKESKEFNDALKLLSDKKRSAPLKKLVEKLEVSLWIY